MRDLPPNMTDYLETRASFRLEVPEVYNYARDVVDAWAAREPGKLALLAVGPDGGNPRRFSFADLAASSNRAASFLAARGVRKGDRVFVMLPRIPDWYDVMLGCLKLGAIPMPGTTLLTGRDIAYRLDRAGATVAVTDPEGAARVDEASERLGVSLERLCVGEPPAPAGWTSWAGGLAEASDRPPAVEPTRSDDPLLIYFTSGTVATKMVLHTQASLGIGHQITARFWQDLKPSDLHWTLSDFGWAKAAWGGQIVKAFVILVPGQTGSQDLVAELQDHCKQVSAPYKYPREIEFVSELPKTISGKIRRVELRQREAAQG
jgi:acyl-coenzyme A synthetase/AMP-(fatty) acid ligase